MAAADPESHLVCAPSASAARRPRRDPPGRSLHRSGTPDRDAAPRPTSRPARRVPPGALAARFALRTPRNASCSLAFRVSLSPCHDNTSIVVDWSHLFAGTAMLGDSGSAVRAMPGAAYGRPPRVAVELLRFRTLTRSWGAIDASWGPPSIAPRLNAGKTTRMLPRNVSNDLALSTLVTYHGGRVEYP